MVPMTNLPPFQARLLAARLGAEGILWQLRGETAVYPFAAVEVLVEAEQVERARALLDSVWAKDAGEPTLTVAVSTRRGDSGGGTCRRRRSQGLLTWAIIVVVLVGLALRFTHLG
jgi:hypothetical protein